MGITDKCLLSDDKAQEMGKVKRIWLKGFLHLSAKSFDCGFQPFLSLGQKFIH